jgi:hypothetical protein
MTWNDRRWLVYGPKLLARLGPRDREISDDVDGNSAP